MCGIVAYVGHREAAGVLLDGLHRLEYRGYDSAGLAVHARDDILLRNYAGEVFRYPDPVSDLSGVASGRR